PLEGSALSSAIGSARPNRNYGDRSRTGISSGSSGRSQASGKSLCRPRAWRLFDSPADGPGGLRASRKRNQDVEVLNLARASSASHLAAKWSSRAKGVNE